MSWFYPRYKHTGPLLQYLLKGEQQQADTAPTHAAEDPQSRYSAFKSFLRVSNRKDATSSSQVRKLYVHFLFYRDSRTARRPVCCCRAVSVHKLWIQVPFPVPVRYVRAEAGITTEDLWGFC